jgi:hypothetical protein
VRRTDDRRPTTDDADNAEMAVAVVSKPAVVVGQPAAVAVLGDDHAEDSQLEPLGARRMVGTTVIVQRGDSLRTAYMLCTRTRVSLHPSVCRDSAGWPRAWHAHVLVVAGLVLQVGLEVLILLGEVEFLAALLSSLRTVVLELRWQLEKLRQPPRAEGEHE